MTAYLAGIAQTRCEEHPEADRIDAIARAVLAAMAWFASEGDPRCYASQSRVARKAGCHRTAVHSAMKRLADLGLIKQTEARSGVPVHWSLVLFAGSEPVAESDRSTPGDLSLSTTGPVAENDRTCSGERHNPSDLSRPPGRERRGRSDAAVAAASAGAPASAAASSMGTPNEDGPGGLVAEVMVARTCSPEAAERWIERRIAGASGPVRNEVAFIRRCLEHEAASAAKTSPAKAAKPGKGAKTSAAKGKPAATRTPRPSQGFKLAAMEQARADRLAGLPARVTAERLGVNESTLLGWCTTSWSLGLRDWHWPTSHCPSPCPKCEAVRGGTVVADLPQPSREEHAPPPVTCDQLRAVMRLANGADIRDVAAEVGVTAPEVAAWATSVKLNGAVATATATGEQLLNVAAVRNALRGLSKAGAA